MSTDFSSAQSFEIKFETASSVPAPYAHYYHLKATFTDAGLQVDYQLRYLGREELSEEEITGEGFTVDDDFAWQGIVPTIWRTEVQRLMKRTQLRNSIERPEEPYFELVFTQASGQAHEGTPQNQTQWEYLAQELIQAIYEVSGRERPLLLRYKCVFANHTHFQLDFTIHFSTRTVDIQENHDTGAPHTREGSWALSQSLLGLVYMPDYFSEKARSLEPRSPGQYIDPGEGVWYAFGSGVQNQSKKRDILAELTQALEKFKS